VTRKAHPDRASDITLPVWKYSVDTDFDREPCAATGLVELSPSGKAKLNQIWKTVDALDTIIKQLEDFNAQ